MINTPKPPYYAVIFTSLLSDDLEGYEEMNRTLDEESKEQQGYLGMDSCRSGLGISISYWTDLDAIEEWKKNVLHQKAKVLGKNKWYQAYKLRIAKVEVEY